MARARRFVAPVIAPIPLYGKIRYVHGNGNAQTDTVARENHSKPRCSCQGNDFTGCTCFTRVLGAESLQGRTRNRTPGRAVPKSNRKATEIQRARSQERTGSPKTGMGILPRRRKDTKLEESPETEGEPQRHGVTDDSNPETARLCAHANAGSIPHLTGDVPLCDASLIRYVSESWWQDSFVGFRAAERRREAQGLPPVGWIRRTSYLMVAEVSSISHFHVLPLSSSSACAFTWPVPSANQVCQVVVSASVTDVIAIFQQFL